MNTHGIKLKTHLKIPFLVFLLQAFPASAGALDFEIAWTETARQEKIHLATSREDEIWRRLHQTARERALSEVRRICEELSGLPAGHACERVFRKNTVNVWGGANHQAYEAEVTLSLRCRAPRQSLNWMEEGWYGFLYPVMKPCASDRVVSGSP